MIFRELHVLCIRLENLLYTRFNVNLAVVCLQTLISTSQANSRLSSLFSWMSSSAVVSLVPQGSSCPQAPWFAYFALHVEEIHNQGSNGLWREVVKELCFASGKPNVDNAVKVSSRHIRILNYN